MAKTKISEYDAISANNTDVDSINIAEGCAPSGINNAIREVMAHLKDFQTGVSGDSLTVGGTLTSGTVDINGGAIDGATVGATTPSTGSFTNLTASGTVSIPDNAISGDKVEGGTINAITINTLTAGQANFADNAKAIFGAGSDLQIYHDGSNSYIDDAGVGDLNIRANNLYLQKYTGETYINAVADGAVGIYHDGAKKFATTSTGIDVTGTVVSDGLTVDAQTVIAARNPGTAEVQIHANVNSSASIPTLTFMRGTATTPFTDSYIDHQFYAQSSSLYYKTGDSTNAHISARFDYNGDISFYEDTGTTAKFFWDASAEALGIGNAAPDRALDVRTAPSIDWQVRIGANNTDLDTYDIGRDVSDGLLYFYGNQSGYNGYVFSGVNGERLRIDTSGNVGIGTSSPAVPLHVNNASSSACRIYLQNTGNTAAGYTQIWSQNNDLVFRAGNIDGLRLDSAGNLGLGVTPSGWSAVLSALQIGGNASLTAETTAGASKYFHISQNAYYDGAWKYLSTDEATSYYQSSGTHVWRTAPSGTANTTTVASGKTYTIVTAGGTNYTTFGAANNNVGTSFTATSSGTGNGGAVTEHIVFNQAMTLDASGNLGVGVTSPSAKLDIVGASATEQFRIGNTTGGTDFGITVSENASTIINSAEGATGRGIQFQSGGTNTILFDSSGNLLVGTTSQPIGTAKFVSSASGTVYGGTFVTDTAGTTPLIAWNKAASGTIYLVEFATGASYLAKGSITSNGTSTSYNTTSDYRLKEDWQPMTGASERVKALKPVNFAWKADGSRVDGFLAHEAQAVVPEAVVGEKDAVELVDIKDEDGNVTGQEERPVYQGIDQSKLVPLLTAALQEALAQIESLTARVSALEGN